MKKEVFFKKVGRKYVPVMEYDYELSNALPKGTHLIMVYPGGQSVKYNVDPAFAPMIAAGRLAEDAISKSIMEASALRPSRSHTPITEEQHLAWKKLSELMGNERYALEFCSYREAAETGVNAMMEEAEKLMTVPTVKKAFEQFLLVCALTKDEKHEPKS